MSDSKKRKVPDIDLPDFESIRVPKSQYKLTAKQQQERHKRQMEEAILEGNRQSEILKRMMDTISTHDDLFKDLIIRQKSNNPVKQTTIQILPAVIKAYPEKIHFDQVDMAVEIAEYLDTKFP